MRDNRFTSLWTREEQRLRADIAARLGLSESDVVRMGVRKLAGELGVSATAPVQENDREHDEQSQLAAA